MKITTRTTNECIIDYIPVITSNTIKEEITEKYPEEVQDVEVFDKGIIKR
ncbi:unnamed protein product [Ceutorhynchus assimilis]|uniref:Uncharacterized protein n=1 Tax=Ceutorhynchus assimilis TaxID=467358 RepID=A0A9N9QPT3_9CUCU|nr:unnamed protein product [Ceutorhynchus assimilis]